MAAFEALWETQEGAPMAIFAIPDESEQKNHAYIGIPRLLSTLIYFDSNAKVLGLNEFPKDERPKVFIPFASYHIMILLGTIFIGVSVVGTWLFVRKRIYETRWYLKLLLFLIPFPYIANETGWVAAEIGRQPWAVYKVLRTADAISITVPAGNILFSLILFIVVYALIAAVGIPIIFRLIRKGPEEPVSEGH
jgi:cytochrome d ubiquinol oxidase subunit I